MSIWCSWGHIGTDPTNWQEVDGAPVPKRPERGNVVSCANGFSNHYPDLTGSHERAAVVAVAHIPVWCVPGHQGEENDDDIAPWLRLDVAAPETLNFWVKDAEGCPTIDSEGATVLLDEEAVRSLRDDLNAWLESPKAHPLAGEQA